MKCLLDLVTKVIHVDFAHLRGIPSDEPANLLLPFCLKLPVLFENQWVIARNGKALAEYNHSDKIRLQKPDELYLIEWVSAWLNNLGVYRHNIDRIISVSSL